MRHHWSISIWMKLNRCGKLLNTILMEFLLFFRFFFSLVYYLCACRSLGLAKIKTPPGHHRKRLAVESSRHHSRPDDSHMFIIKLPPNPYYYANSKTAQNKNGIEDKNQKVRTNLPKCKLQQVSVSSKFALSQRFWRESAKRVEWINEREWNFLEYSTSDFSIEHTLK